MKPGAAGETLATLIEEGSKALQSALQRGSHRKREVVALQILLHELGFGGPLGSVELVADGHYGDATVLALRAFAQANGSHAKGERVTLNLAQKILARYGSLEHLRRLEGDIERQRSAKPSKAVRGYKKPDNGGDADRVQSLQILLNDHGARLEVTGDYDRATRHAVKPLAETGNGRPLNLGAARALVDGLSAKYGERWRSPGVVRKGTDRGADEITDHTAAPKPVPKTLPERDFFINTGVTARLLDVRPVGQQLENWCWAASTQMMIGYLRSLGETECPTCGRSGNSDEDISQAAQMNRRLRDSEVNCGADRTADYDYKTCDRGGWPHFFEFQNQIRSTEWASKRHVLEEHGMVLRDGGPRLRLRHRLTDWQLKALAYTSGPEFRKRLDDAEGAALSWETLTYLLDQQRPVAFAFRYPHPSAGHMRLAVGYVVTPGDHRWVAVADPLPPETGEVHLIPYEFYRDGPFDGHWRDYWVPPADEQGSNAPDRLGSHEPIVGRELVASYITYPTRSPVAQPSVGEDPEDPERLSDDDGTEAFLVAKEGLQAVEAIALHAEPMAVKLGMGAAWARASAKLMADSEQERAAEEAEDFVPGYQLTEIDQPQAEPGRFVIRNLKSGDLELNEDDFVPVYELTVEQLQGWKAAATSATEVPSLLDRPREIIFAVTRPDQAPMRFFSAVTVRRKKDRWKLSSLGRASLMRFYLGKQLERLLEHDVLEGTVGVGAFSMFFYSALHSSDQTAANARVMLREFGIDESAGAELSDQEAVDRVEQWFQLERDRARTEGEALSKQAAARRAKQLEKLEARLDEDPSRYPETVWEERDALEAKWTKASTGDSSPKRRDELIAWAGAWKKFWKAVRRTEGRDDIRRTLRERSSQEVASLLRNVYYPRGLLYADGGYWRTEASLLDLVEREEVLEELCSRWSNGSEDREEILERIFETNRDQEIEWLHRSSKLHPSARRRLDELREEKRIDQGNPRPKYLLSVPELYQLLVAYPPLHATDTDEPQLQDQVFPVYQKSFHRPGRCIKKGSLLEVLLDLQDVANEREVVRGR